MRPTAVLASALVNPVLLLTAAVPGDTRGLQSVQSVPRVQELNSDPGPPSSHSPSEAKSHISVQDGGGGGEGEGGGGGAKHVEIGPWTPVRIVAQVQTVPLAT